MPTETTKQVISAGQKKVDQFITDKFLRLFEASTEDDAQWKLARTNPQEFLRANKIKVPADLEVGFTEEPKVPDHLKKLLPTKKFIVKCFGSG